MSRAVARSFGGTYNEYAALHHWVVYHLGSPKMCENCGNTEHHRYEWANVSGDYKRDLDDWVRLCKHCHRNIDARSECINGHRLEEDNIYTYPDGRHTCRICARVAKRKWKEEHSVTS